MNARSVILGSIGIRLDWPELSLLNTAVERDRSEAIAEGYVAISMHFIPRLLHDFFLLLNSHASLVIDDSQTEKTSTDHSGQRGARNCGNGESILEC